MKSTLQIKSESLVDFGIPESPGSRTVEQTVPFWKRLLLLITELVVTIFTLGYIKRVLWLEKRWNYSPQWSTRTAAEQRIKETLRSSVTTAKRLAHPLLHIDTEIQELENETGPESAVTTPLSLAAYNEVYRQRSIINQNICEYLHSVPVEQLQAPFHVTACTWNVDQTAPPLCHDGFLVWLIGKDLANSLELHREKEADLMMRSAALQDELGSFSLSSMSTLSSAPTVRQRSRARLQKPEVPQTSILQSRLEELSRMKKAVGEEKILLLEQFPDLFVISLQEVEMSGAALVRELTKTSAQWTDAIVEALSVASDRKIEYRKLKVVQLVGLVLIVLVQVKHVDFVSHVRLSLTRTGALSVLGNKGSVAMRASIYGKRFLFISAHFVAHAHNEQRRTQNYQAALNDLRFNLPAWMDDESEVLWTFANASPQLHRSLHDSSVIGSSTWDRLLSFRPSTFRAPFSTDKETRVLDQHDYVFFIGDLNSRLHALQSSEIRTSVERREYDFLLCHDELRQLMVSGEAFDAFQEQWIYFPPTYKFDPGTAVYDTSRKKRDPAWCDRILFRVLASDAAAKADSNRDEVPVDGGQICAADEALGRRSSSSQPRSISSPAIGANGRNPTGSWVALSDLKEDQISQAAQQTVESSSSSDDAEVDKEALRKSEKKAAAIAKVAAQAGQGFLDECRSASTVHGRSSAPLHSPRWGNRRCTPTFRAVRRSHGESNRSSGPQVSARFPMVENHISPLEYECIEVLQQSDHRPVRSSFDVNVISLQSTTVHHLLKKVLNN